MFGKKKKEEAPSTAKEADIEAGKAEQEVPEAPSKSDVVPPEADAAAEDKPEKEKFRLSGIFKWRLFIRTALIIYVILAVFAFIETEKLADNDLYKVEGTTIYVPLVLCLPQQVSLANSTWFINTNLLTTPPCREMDYLILGCAVSMILSAAAIIMFLIIDIFVQYPRFQPCVGPFNKSSAVGMGLFSCFILLQAGICMGAIVEQSYFWMSYLQEAIEDTIQSGQGDAITFTTVRTYANLSLMGGAAIWGFVCCGGVLVECILFLVCYAKKEKEEEEEAQKKEEEAQEEQASSAPVVEPAALAESVPEKVPVATATSPEGEVEVSAVGASTTSKKSEKSEASEEIKFEAADDEKVEKAEDEEEDKKEEPEAEKSEEDKKENAKKEEAEKSETTTKDDAKPTEEEEETKEKKKETSEKK